MYLAILLLLVALGLYVSARGARSGRAGTVALGVAVLVGVLLFFSLLGLWGEWLWFESLGFGHRFWTVLEARIGTVVVGGTVAALLTFLLVLPSKKGGRLSLVWPPMAAAVAGAIWGTGNWMEVLLWWNAQPAAVSDPILHRNASFYLFKLPFYDGLLLLLSLVAVISLAGSVVPSITRTKLGRVRLGLKGHEPTQSKSLRLSAAFAVILLGAAAWLKVYHLLYSDWGAVSGPGWTDVAIRLPAFQTVAVATIVVGFAWLFGAAFPRVRTISGLRLVFGRRVVGLLVLVWVVALGALPILVQKFIVEPNEITFEKPYIANNIHYTRLGFGLDRAEEREFPVAGAFDQATVANNRQLVSEVRLWDWRALAAVHKQFQEIRLYYEFHDVDIDRYHLHDGYRQVMVSTRELEQRNLPPQSQTFVNRRFKYTHGYGLTMTPVSEFSDDGLPNFLVKDIPPQSVEPELNVDRPAIYYGELTREHVFVNTSEEEFDYPRGDGNVYTRYSGRGGVELTGWWEKFLFGWKFDGSKFFFSSYPGKGSRVLFHRQIEDRVRTVAPFLKFDEDPYIVLSEGRLYWMIDGYTVSKYYPYSEPFSSREVIEYSEGNTPRSLRTNVNPDLNGVNYVRNSVKAVVDAYDGTVDFYVFEPEDPIIQTWLRIFPRLLKTESEMPAGLREHVRYPADFLLTQGIVYSKYHMENPEVFYNQEDLWVRATEKYYSRVQPVEPYYVMWQLPGADATEFSLILPFTPKNRQVLIGWMAGLCDPGNYGRLLTYKFPKERTVLGPQQMETKIDQDRFLSGQLTLWDQRGSQVIRGNVLAIPIEETLLYVEPIYLQAETAAYPELRLVAVMHGDTLSYAPSFSEALQGLFQKGSQTPAQAPSEDLAKAANQAFESYLQLQGEGRFEEAAQQLNLLRETLRKMVQTEPSRK